MRDICRCTASEALHGLLHANHLATALLRLPMEDLGNSRGLLAAGKKDQIGVARDRWLQKQECQYQQSILSSIKCSGRKAESEAKSFFNGMRETGWLTSETLVLSERQRLALLS